MTTRALICVDVETLGLHDSAAIIEVAAVNVDTGEELHFVPELPRYQLQNAEFEALAINRYFERRTFRDALSAEGTSRAYCELAEMLRLNTFAGSNPTFDSKLLAKFNGATWHHRLADLAAYAAGKLDIDPTELPGLAAVCEKLGVVNEDPHSALGDARATAECFRRLRTLAPRITVHLGMADGGQPGMASISVDDRPAA
jgi:DNA polymerase III subunit epsilon